MSETLKKKLKTLSYLCLLRYPIAIKKKTIRLISLVSELFFFRLFENLTIVVLKSSHLRFLATGPTTNALVFRECPLYGPFALKKEIY